jgi:hypothetical protein
MRLQRLNAEVIRGLSLAGREAAEIYAYKKTGLLVNAKNGKLLRAEDRAEWNPALQEYDAPILALWEVTGPSNFAVLGRLLANVADHSLPCPRLHTGCADWWI